MQVACLAMYYIHNRKLCINPAWPKLLPRSFPTPGNKIYLLRGKFSELKTKENF